MNNTTDIDKTKSSDDDSFIPLPKGYDWEIYDMSDLKCCKIVSQFLSTYNITNLKNNYRIQYTPEYLKWLFIVPNQISICIGVVKKGILIGFIGGVTKKIQLFKKEIDIVEINFMCVHAKARGKKLTKKLIKQFTKMFEIKGYTMGVYNNDIEEGAFFSDKYQRRPLNIKKLIDYGLLKLDKKLNLMDVEMAYYLSKKTVNKQFKKIEEIYLKETYNLFVSYINKYSCYPIYTYDEFVHIFYNNEFVTTYVLLIDDVVVDFISYLNFSVKIFTKKGKFKRINRGYLYYYTSDEETVYRLINDIMIIAKNNGIDEFITTNIMEHGNILVELNFMDGINKFNYHFYNISDIKIQAKQIGKIMF